MPYVLIRHTVRNFKKWKSGYDAHSTTRKKAGSKGARLFRNVDKPLPHFVETFLEDGYMDMYKVMRELQKVGFKGVAIPDHIPHLADDGRVGMAYIIGQMQMLQRRAIEEVK